MFYPIQFLGFTPERAEVEKFTDAIKTFSEFCPGDSHIKMTISKRESQFVADVSVRHPHGHVASICEATTLPLLLRSLFDDLYSKIRIWRHNRFLAPFNFQGQTADTTMPRTESDQQQKPKVLIIDDDPAALTALDVIFTRAGYETKSISDTFRAVSEVSSGLYDLVVLDWHLPYMEGAELMRLADIAMSKKIPRDQRSIPVVTCSGVPKTMINFPNLSHFLLLRHWEKGIPYKTIYANALEMLPALGR